MNAVPPPPSLGGRMAAMAMMPHHAHGQGVPVMPSQSAMASQKERSIRSIFVGNIPYEATEEQLVEIFSEVGPVANFRLVRDKDTGRPKGYGFCEFQDQETAASAVRNLSTRELHGRVLRVDSSANAKMQQRQDEDPTRGAVKAERAPVTSVRPVSPSEAPKVIAEAVDQLSARQVFDVLRQLKRTAIDHPEDAHQLMASHPHVAYAVLLAQVSMGMVEPDVAEGLLHPPRPPLPILQPLQATSPSTVGMMTTQHQSTMPFPPLVVQAPQYENQPRSAPAYERESRVPPFKASPSSAAPPADPVTSSQPPGLRSTSFEDAFGPRGPRQPQAARAAMEAHLGRGPPSVGKMPPSVGQMPPSVGQMSPSVGQMSQSSIPAVDFLTARSGGSDSEKAELIMQVMNLTDQHMKLLTAEQRESVMVLKKQVSSAIK